ncbi:MAG: hypothetical protein [Bacteriophage sp.]|nr:MAG: hypothetical protein [Bacteriophage sp.]
MNMETNKVLKIDAMAQELANMEGNGYDHNELWTDLYNMLESYINARCTKLYNYYKFSYKLNIEKEEFLGIGLTALLGAVKNFDSTRGHFYNRLIACINQQAMKVVRDAQASPRALMTYGCLSLDKGQEYNDSDDMVLADIVADNFNLEDEYIKKENSLVGALIKWSSINEKTKRDSRLITIAMLAFDKEDKKERLMAETEKNWVTTRKALSRANQKFIKYLKDNNIEIAV